MGHEFPSNAELDRLLAELQPPPWLQPAQVGAVAGDDDLQSLLGAIPEPARMPERGSIYPRFGIAELGRPIARDVALVGLGGALTALGLAAWRWLQSRPTR